MIKIKLVIWGLKYHNWSFFKSIKQDQFENCRLSVKSERFERF